MSRVPEDSDLHDSSVSRVIAEYLENVDQGIVVDRHDFLDRYPDLAQELQSFFEDIDDVDRMMARINRSLEKAFGNG